MNIFKLQQLLNRSEIIVSEFIENNKASENYVRTRFIQPDGFKWDTVVPYYIRRSGLFLDDEVKLATYLISIRPYFTIEKMNEWRETEWKKWAANNAEVTKEFFKVLLSFKEETVFPPNDNPARRIQDIKDAGYTVASLARAANGKTARVLLPIPLTNQMGYETFTPQFKARVIRILGGINAYEAKATTPKALIPDHKFSEVRWDEDTKGENPMTMTDAQIKEKFQLLDNQRNQQKREVCRKCFQENIRGKIYGINFFYEGDEKWDESIPKVGKEAERGCIGCAWYDIQKWRELLNKKVQEEKNEN